MPIASRTLDRGLIAVLAITVMDTAYLSWRYLALHAGRVIPGTGLCSWTDGIDCDQVLRTPQARAFFVPNALLGFGFFFGCLLWFVLGTRFVSPIVRREVHWLLALWLCIATVFTFRFFWLLIHLDHLCPFCPWNHLLTWIACGLSVTLVRRDVTRRDTAIDVPRVRLLAPLALLCVGQLFLWNGLWGLAVRSGMLPM